MNYKNLMILILTPIIFLGCTPQIPQPDQNNNVEEPVFCTMDAKMCPDGSYVGRIPPNCEFAKCPETSDLINSDYIGLQDWPPTISKSKGIFTCAGEIHSVNGSDYCVSSEIGAAAGSRYVTYNYLKNLEDSGEIMTITFTLRFPQCENYDEPNKTECKNDQENLELDSIIDQIVKSVKR